MLDIASAALAAAVVATVAIVAHREHKAAVSARLSLLDGCRHLLDHASLRIAEDGFPALKGRSSAGDVSVRLILDTMTIRRLPQLWLSATLVKPIPAVPSLAMIVRPAGTEFYSITSSLPQRLDAPPGFPSEVLIRGEGPQAQTLLDRLGPQLGALLHDPKIKEIAVTSRGVRILRQAGEGERGPHLLLRQSRFLDAAVPAADLQLMLAQLHLVSSEAMEAHGRVAA